jgi:hypothetical protein
MKFPRLPQQMHSQLPGILYGKYKDIIPVTGSCKGPFAPGEPKLTVSGVNFQKRYP